MPKTIVPPRIEERLLEAKQLAIQTTAENVRIEKELGILEVRMAAVEKFMDLMIDPVNGVVPKLAVLSDKFEENIKSNGKTTNVLYGVLGIILTLLGYLLMLHLKP